MDKTDQPGEVDKRHRVNSLALRQDPYMLNQLAHINQRLFINRTLRGHVGAKRKNLNRAALTLNWDLVDKINSTRLWDEVAK